MLSVVVQPLEQPDTKFAGLQPEHGYGELAIITVLLT